MHHYKNKPKGAKGIAIRSKFLYNEGVVGFKSAAGIAADFRLSKKYRGCHCEGACTRGNLAELF